MKTRLMTAMVMIAATVALGAAQAHKHGDATLAGAWNLTIKGPAAHGDLAATMELQQKGTRLTGSFTAHGNTHTLAGEFSGGELSLESTDTPADQALSFSGKLKDDGTLAGYLSSPMGDMQWTAARAKS